jgi:hypothetical protein
MFHPRPEALATFDAELGWRPKPGTWTEVELRSEREYVPAPSGGGGSLAAFGDSFVYGSDVTGEGAWPRVLERGDPALWVMSGLPCLDASDAFRAAADGVFRPDWFVGEFHHSASGNRVVAEWLRERLR